MPRKGPDLPLACDVRVNSPHPAQTFVLPSSMSKPSPRRRIKFADVAVGERFFDPISAEYFVKQTETLAAMVTGIGDGTIPDEFEPDDIVGIDLH